MKVSTLFLKIVIFLIGSIVLSLCLISLYLIIFRGGAGAYLPVIIMMYLAAVPFIFALYQGVRLLSYIDKSTAFSSDSINSLEKIKYSAIAISIIYILGMPYIFYVADKDDAPGVVAIVLVMIFSSFVVTTFAVVLEKLIHSGLEIKSENDLTV